MIRVCPAEYCCLHAVCLLDVAAAPYHARSVEEVSQCNMCTRCFAKLNVMPCILLVSVLAEHSLGYGLGY